MHWRTHNFFSLIITSLLPCATLAVPQSLPLTLSAHQAVKLQQLFPNVVSEKDIKNASFNTPTEHLIWNKIPLTITLPVNRERLISFPDNVQFGYDNTVLTKDIFSIQNVDGTVYLVAKKPFSTQRVFVQLKQSGQLILLDLSAKPDADDTPLSIILPAATTALSTTDLAMPGQAAPNKTIDYTELSRFAIQQLYAPKRLLSNPRDIYRVPMHTTRTVSLLEGDEVIAMPLISWRFENQFITAVLLRNRLTHNVILDPRRIRGQWKTAAFFPQTRLMPTGNSRDSTTVFLISDQPFANALGR